MAGKTVEISPPIRLLVKRIGEKLAPVEVILFGSRAKGDAFNSSDWDLLVISNRFEGLSFRERMDKVLSLIEKPVGQDVEVFCYTENDIQKRKNELGLVRDALETGIPIK
ncbi:MAG: nucleotidyltransferase domain-containing protein [Candidatus Diapherotrites archaeon]